MYFFLFYLKIDRPVLEHTLTALDTVSSRWYLYLNCEYFITAYQMHMLLTFRMFLNILVDMLHP